MKKQLPIGLHDYKEIVEKGYCYVDKVLLVKEVWESGTGHYDIMIIPQDKNDQAVIIEFKVAKKSSLGETAQQALDQIQAKKYAQELYHRGIESITAYGIAFKGKEVFALSQEIAKK